MSSQVVRFLQQENQRLIEENRLLREQVIAMRGYLEGLRALQRAAETITAQDEPLALLDRTLYSALTVLDAADGSILLLDRETDELVFVVVHGEVRQALRGHRIPANAGIAGWVASNKEPQIVNNVRADQRFYDAIDEAFQFMTHSMLCAPMISRDRVLGVMEVLNKFDQRAFTAADADLLSTLASIAAAVIDRLESEQGGRLVHSDSSR